MNERTNKTSRTGQSGNQYLRRVNLGREAACLLGLLSTTAIVVMVGTSHACISCSHIYSSSNIIPMNCSARLSIPQCIIS